MSDPAAFAALAAELAAEPDEGLTAHTVIDRLVALVPDAEQASITVRHQGGHRTLASNGDTAAEADAAQYRLEEGPCVETSDDAHTWLRSGDVAADRRWPRWGPEARALGVGSSLSVQLMTNERPQGALNLYSSMLDAFSDPAVIDLMLIYAIHAANALTSARLATNLNTALGTRHVIGMAQGIVMERFGLDEHRSFELLRRLSSADEMKVRDVAARIVETRELPESP